MEQAKSKKVNTRNISNVKIEHSAAADDDEAAAVARGRR